MKVECTRNPVDHQYDSKLFDKCPICWADGPHEIHLFDFDKNRFNENERFFIETINELSEYIREIKTEVDKLNEEVLE